MAAFPRFNGRGSSPRATRSPIRTKLTTAFKRCLLNRSVNVTLERVQGGEGNHYILENGSKIYDCCGGAGVASLGRRSKRVEHVMSRVMKRGLSYVPSMTFETAEAADLADHMIADTNGMMRKAVFYCSGSEATEAALKISRQYHAKEKSPAEESRTLFIAREQSYHGATLGALNVSGHPARKALYKGIMPENIHTVPACNPYRNLNGRTNKEYVEWHRQELVKKIEELGQKNVAGFIVEPVVGATLGCAPAVPGYLSAMRQVCDQYDILLIFDEIMCGMGRTGHIHAWQAEGVVPDIQLVGKGLAAGFQPISAMLVGPKVVKAFETGPSRGAFNHGHTFQNYPLAAAAALEVQKIFRDEKLLENIREKGRLLQQRIRGRLESHRYVGDIRGPPEGLFLGIEFVQNKELKTPFPSSDSIYRKIVEKGLHKPYEILVYSGAGTYDGSSGDHILLAPAYNISHADVKMISDRVCGLIEDFFDEYDGCYAKRP